MKWNIEWGKTEVNISKITWNDRVRDKAESVFMCSACVVGRADGVEKETERTDWKTQRVKDGISFSESRMSDRHLSGNVTALSQCVSLLTVACCEGFASWSVKNNCTVIVNLLPGGWWETALAPTETQRPKHRPTTGKDNFNDLFGMPVLLDAFYWEHI